MKHFSLPQHKTDTEQVLQSLEEHSVHLVEVSWNSCNPVHNAILFKGFNNLNYTEIYSNSYDAPIQLGRKKPYYLKVIKKLCDHLHKKQTF